MSARPARTAVYATTGRTLIHHALDPDALTLDERGRVELPENGQYAWPHPSGRLLYVACSNGAPGARGDRHCACALALDAVGEPRLHGPVIALPGRPVHITVDGPGRHILIAYNNPSALTVHRLAAEGSLGDTVPQRVPVDAGVFAHQTRLMPGHRTALLVARGNDATAHRPEDPGSLRVFDYDDGQLAARTVIAPGGGLGYGPRHVDFSPDGRALYVALERQNLLHVHDLSGASVAATPAHVLPTLAEPQRRRPQQRAGTVRVHPHGHALYIANRADGSATQDGRPVFVGGENNLAVFALEAGRAPRLVQHVPTQGYVPRTFAFDASGRVLVAANSRALWQEAAGPNSGGVEYVPASLALFRVGDDGRLDYARRYPVDVGAGTLFWMGMVALPQA